MQEKPKEDQPELVGVLRALVGELREMAANRERMCGVLLVGIRVLARDVVALAEVAPTDPLRPLIASGARERARKVLAELGDDERAH